MPSVSTFVYLLATLLLFHSAYSAHEFFNYLKALPLTSNMHEFGLPVDIKIEALVAVILVFVAAILSSIGELKPIQFSKATSEMELTDSSIYNYLEGRLSFVDIAAKRKAFAEWKKSSSS